MAKTKMKVVSADETSATITMEELAEKARAVNKLSGRYEIKKAKLKDENFLEAEYNETLQDSSNTVKKDCTAAVHADLKEAFKRMDNILLNVCEQQDDSVVVCNGFTIGKDGSGVTLIGYRDLESGSVLNLTSPYTKFEDNGDLEHAISVAKQEVLQYLFEGKHAPDAQLSLFPEGDNDLVEEEF
jgi:hypothetical protein